MCGFITYSEPIAEMFVENSPNPLDGAQKSRSGRHDTAALFFALQAIMTRARGHHHGRCLIVNARS
jgi:hypothetical protein